MALSNPIRTGHHGSRCLHSCKDTDDRNTPLHHSESVGDRPMIVHTSLLAMFPNVSAHKTHKAFLASTWSGRYRGTAWGHSIKPFAAFNRPRLEEIVTSSMKSPSSTVLIHRLPDSHKPISIAVFETFSGEENLWYRNDGPMMKAYRRGITNLVDIKFMSSHRQVENSAAQMIETVVAHTREHLFGGEAFVVVADCAGFQRTVFEKIKFVHMRAIQTIDNNGSVEKLHRMIRVIESSLLNGSCGRFQ